MSRYFNNAIAIPMGLVRKGTLQTTQRILHSTALLRKVGNILFSSIAEPTLWFGNHSSTVEPIRRGDSSSKSAQVERLIQNKRVVVPWLQPVTVEDSATIIRKILTLRRQDRLIESLTRGNTKDLSKSNKQAASP